MGDSSPGTNSPHPFVCLARDAIAFYLETGRTVIPRQSWYEQFETLRRPAAVFVTLRKSGELRGCMGTFEPTYPDMALEIIENAISAAFRDPRFCPVGAEEFEGLSVSIDIVKGMEPVLSTADLNPSCYGVIVRQGARRGLLLPGIDDITSIEQQVAIAREKGGIGEHETIELYRFEVDRYH
jgi:AmmeMemoRadiSam system protein A